MRKKQKAVSEEIFQNNNIEMLSSAINESLNICALKRVLVQKTWTTAHRFD